jgi:hypothetical protein
MKRRIAPTLGALAQGALAVLLALCLAQPALASGKTKTRHRAKKKLATVHGLRAYIDPATGKLTRPNATDAGGPAPALAAGSKLPTDEATRDVAVERLPNGAEMARLDDRFQEYEVVRVGADGKLVRSCVQGPAAAAKVRATPPAPAKELQ